MSTLEIRKLTPAEVAICKWNTESLSRRLSLFRKKCGNPFCGYPLAYGAQHFFVLNYGDVCEVCHDLYMAVKMQTGLNEAHQEYLASQKSKNKILDNNEYFK